MLKESKLSERLSGVAVDLTIKKNPDSKLKMELESVEVVEG